MRLITAFEEVVINLYLVTMEDCFFRNALTLLYDDLPPGNRRLHIVQEYNTILPNESLTP